LYTEIGAHVGVEITESKSGKWTVINPLNKDEAQTALFKDPVRTAQ
jgi:hypothetical protein